MAMFNSYVKLPEGTLSLLVQVSGNQHDRRQGYVGNCGASGRKKNTVRWSSPSSTLSCSRFSDGPIYSSYTSYTGWFGTCFFSPHIGNNNPNWLIFFRGVETTSQFFRFRTTLKRSSMSEVQLRKGDSSPEGPAPKLSWTFSQDDCNGS